MVLCSVAWCHNNYLDRACFPFYEIATIYREHKKINQPWYILILEGYDHFKQLEEELIPLDCFIVDVNQLYNELCYRYRSLLEIYNNRFLFNNTIRWIICYKYFNNEPFLNTDIDLVINENPDLIIDPKKSLYMGSTCFIYMHDPFGFYHIYDEMLSHLIQDYTDFKNMAIDIAFKNKTRPEDNPWNLCDPDPTLHEEALFYVLLKKYKLDWSYPSDQYIYIPFMSLLYNFDKTQNYHSKNAFMMSDIKGHDNEYSFTDKKHFINKIPMAYMHYQYLFRKILLVYDIQEKLGIPEHLKYCPDFSLREGWHQSKEYEDYTNFSKTYRKEQYSNNCVADQVLSNLISEISQKNIHILGYHADPGSVWSALKYETYGLNNILNNNYWFSKDVFI